MGIKRRKIDTALERQILTGMIVSDTFLREVRNIYKPEYLEIGFAPIVAKWCLDYYEQYTKAPKEVIKDIFRRWCKENDDEEKQEFIKEFLHTLSDEYEHGDKFNAEYLIDKTETHFKARAFKLLAGDITACLSKNDVEEAENVLSDFRKVERVTSRGIDPFDDKEAIHSAFNSTMEPLFKVPGALGRLWNSQLTRDSFIGLMGPEKRGKTWWLMFLGNQAHRGRCNVAEFQVGDLSEAQRVRRQHIYLSKKSDLSKYCGELLVPVLDCEYNQKDTCEKKYRLGSYGIIDKDGNVEEDFDPKYKICTLCQKKSPRDFKGALYHELRPAVDPLTWREAWKAGQEYKNKVRAKGYKLSTHSNNSINVEGIRNILKLWEDQEGFIPDVIIIDYADILAPERGGTKEFRHQQNETWKALRRLSQDLHCCVITATQADAASYGQKSVTRANFSEDKRKFAHATAMYALNQTPEEKRKGLMRIGPLVVREDDYDENYNVHVGQCLQIGRPYLFSY